VFGGVSLGTRLARKAELESRVDERADERD
jgi:hypothetical protein